MVRWCIRLTRLTLVCEVIRYRLVQVQKKKKKKKKLCFSPRSIVSSACRQSVEALAGGTEIRGSVLMSLSVSLVVE